MNILAIETSTEKCSAALVVEKEGRRVYFESVDSNSAAIDSQQTRRSSSNEILPMIDALLAEAALHPSQLTALAFGCGPGSFTGLRVAAGIVQGIALAHDLSVIPVSSLQAMAQSAYKTYGCSTVWTAIDAHVQSFYWSIFALEKEKNETEIMMPIIQETLVPVSDWTMPEEKDVKTSALCVGSGWHYLQETLEKTQKIWKMGYPTARAIVDLALTEYYQSQQVSSEKALPAYLHEPYYVYNKHFNQGKL